MKKSKELRKLERIEDITTKLWVAGLLGTLFLIGQPVKVCLAWGFVTIGLFLVSIVAEEKQRDYYKNEEGEYTTEDY